MKEDSSKLKEYLIDCFGVWKYVDPELVARVIPSSEWVEIPEGAEECYYFDGSDPVVPEDLLFYTKDLKETWTGEYWSDNTICINLTYHEIKTYVKAHGRLVWKRDKLQETVNPINRNEFNPLIPQEGGDHYKLRPIQPIEYSERNGLSMSQGNIVKYITRHKEKNGIEDLAKVVHYALLESYFVYGVKGSTELKQRILKMLGD